MFGHIEVHHPPTIMSQNDQDKQSAKGRGGRHEKVDGNEVLDLSSKNVRHVWDGGFLFRVSIMSHEPVRQCP
jgi:hypothetical protein